MNDPVITLLTDFGVEDGYAAAMKGVILGICPNARIVDVTHLAPTHDIRAGSFLLASACGFFPAGTIHLAVVDPGVGTKRAPIAVRTPRYFFVGPDNGLFSLALRDEARWEARALQNSDYWRPEVSTTFHGRDIFAPVAAHLARGVPFEELGPSFSPFTPQWSSIARSGETWVGEVIHIDHFGNAISNITRNNLDEWGHENVEVVRVRGSDLPVVATYGDARAGTPVALIGGSGYLEIAVSRGSAAESLGIRPGDRVQVCRR